MEKKKTQYLEKVAKTVKLPMMRLDKLRSWRFYAVLSQGVGVN